VSKNVKAAISKLHENQLSNGGFSYLVGGGDAGWVGAVVGAPGLSPGDWAAPPALSARNSHATPMTLDCICPSTHSGCQCLKRFRPKQRKIDANPALGEAIWQMLGQRMSPELYCRAVA